MMPTTAVKPGYLADYRDPRADQVRRIRVLSAELRRRAPDRCDAARDYVKAHIDDLYAIERMLIDTLETLDAEDARREALSLSYGA